jgi:hypothetical protein
VRRSLAIASLLLLVLGAACGKYGAPVRPSRPSYDEGTVYDAGQPIERNQRRR